jgi:hypothetical protein
MTETKQLKLIAESHQMQLDGWDYQKAAVETAQLHDLDGVDDWETYLLMEASPSDTCPCAACCSHDWDEN